MVDRWVLFMVSQFVSAALGFLFGYAMKTFIFIYIGGFFFAMGMFAATRWGYDKWKSRGKPRKQRGR